jgi:hypothetical protein
MKLNTLKDLTSLQKFKSYHVKMGKVFIQSALFQKVFNGYLNAWLSQKQRILLLGIQNLIEHLQVINKKRKNRFYQATYNI